MRADTRSLGNSTFWRVGDLVLRRDRHGALIEYTHELTAGTRPNAYADGPFCRLSLPAAPAAAGVYAVEVGGAVVYIGECANLSQRFGGSGYGSISPRNCHDDGQTTNCKLNSRVLVADKYGVNAVVWFHHTEKRHQLESVLIAEMQPIWNGRALAECSPQVRRATPKPRVIRPKERGRTTDEFRRALRVLLESAENSGVISAKVRAGDLHREVGGYPSVGHRMPACCSAMRFEMAAGDRVVEQPPKGNGANLTVEYFSPRSSTRRSETD